MEKQDELKAFARMCVQGLSDDVELRQERETELLVHLKSAFAEERQNASDDEALENTFKRFGDPEEISSQLIDGNAERLSRNARIRRAAKWLLLPLLVIGVLFCIDIRGILSSVTLVKTMRPTWFESRGRKEGLDWDDNLQTRKMSDNEQLLFDYYYDRAPRLEVLSRLYEAYRDDAMICAIYAQELSQPKSDMQAKLSEVIENGRRIDPDNPLYDYLECLMLMREGCQLPPLVKYWLSNMDNTAIEDYTIKDRGKLDMAIAVYKQALVKGPINTYNTELAEKIRGMLKIREDMLGGMQLIDFRSRERLLLLSGIKSISRHVVLYCDILRKEGEKAKAIELIGTWRTFLLQYFKETDRHFSEIRCGIHIADDFLKGAKRLGADEEANALQAVVDVEKERKASRKDDLYLNMNGGLMSAFQVPYTLETENVAEWSIERRLEAAAFDAMSIGLGCVCLLIIIALLGIDVFAMWIGGRHPFLFIMSKSVYKKLLLKAILLPTLVYFVITYIVGGKGGPWFILQIITIAYLCLVWPLYHGICCQHILTKWTRSIGAGGHEGFRASRSFNMLCLFVVLLLFYGCILRPLANWREHHYASMETLVIPRDGVEIREERAAHEWQERFLEKVISSKIN